MYTYLHCEYLLYCLSMYADKKNIKLQYSLLQFNMLMWI